MTDQDKDPTEEKTKRLQRELSKEQEILNLRNDKFLKDKEITKLRKALSICTMSEENKSRLKLVAPDFLRDLLLRISSIASEALESR